MTYVVTSACIDVMDRQCMDQCPVDAIYAGTRMVYISPDDCIDCGACVPVCPQSAVFLGDYVPDDEQPYIAVNRDFFQSSDITDIEGPNPDHPLVAALPPS